MLLVLVVILTVTVVGFSILWALGEQRRYLLFVYVLFCSMLWAIQGYYRSTGYLGLGKAWTCLDIMLLCLVALAWPTSKPVPQGFRAKSIDVPMITITALAVLGVIVGFLRPDTVGVLNFTKKFLYLPIFFVARSILIDRGSVSSFYKALKWFAVAFFLLHVLIAFRIFTPPITEEGTMAGQGGWGRQSRVEIYMFPAIYLCSFAVALCGVLYGRKGLMLNLVVLAVSVVGVLLSQTRMYYVALAAIGAWTLLFIRGRIKLVALAALGTIGVFILVEVAGVNLFFRFTGRFRQRMNITSYKTGWRGMEYRTVAEKLSEEPQWVMTGRGFGATHYAPGSREGTIALLHNEYLKVINSLGLIGLVCHLVLLFGMLFHNRRYRHDPAVGPMLLPGRMIFSGVIPASLFGGFVWSPGTGPVMLCFLAIAANGLLIANDVHEQAYLDDYEQLPIELSQISTQFA